MSGTVSSKTNYFFITLFINFFITASSKNYFWFFVVMFILFKLTPFLYDDSMILWCTDGLSDEERLAWQNRVIEVQSKYDYWLNDAKSCDNNLKYLEETKHTMSQEEYLAQKAEDEEFLKLSLRNMRQEERMLHSLQEKGLTVTSSSTTSTTRNISEVSGSNEQGPSKK